MNAAMLVQRLAVRVECLNGRMSSEVPGLSIHSHRALKPLLRGSTAYNAGRQRVLDGRTPSQVVAERLKAKPELANPAPRGRAGLCDATKAPLISGATQEVSQPDSWNSLHVPTLCNVNGGDGG